MAASELLEARIGRVRLVAQAYAAATRLEAALGAAVRETERAHE
jgi:hypothetical protein